MPRHRRMNLERNHEEEHEKLFNDYFSNALLYMDEHSVESTECINMCVLRIVEALRQQDEYLQMRFDVTCRSSHSLLQNCTTIIYMLACGTFTDNMDDYLRIG